MCLCFKIFQSLFRLQIYLISLKFFLLHLVGIFCMQCSTWWSCDTHNFFEWLMFLSYLEKNLKCLKSWREQIRRSLCFDSSGLKKAASFLLVKIRSYLVMMHMKMMFSCCSTCILSIFPTQFSSTKRSKSDLYATLQLLLNSGNPSHQSPNWWWRLIIHRLCSIKVVKFPEKHLITPKIRASCKNLWNVNKSYLIGIKVCVSLSLKHLFHTIVSFLGLARPFFPRGSLKECRL